MARMMAPPSASAAPVECDLDRLRRIYRDMPQALVWISAERRIADANAAAAAVLGVSRAALIGQSLDSAACRTTRRDGSEFPPGESPISRAFDSGRPVRKRGGRLARRLVGWRALAPDERRAGR